MMTFFTGGENKARSTEPMTFRWPSGSAPCIVASAECNKGSIQGRGTTTRTLCQSGSHSREGGTSGGRLQCAVLGVRTMSPFPYSKEAALTLVVTQEGPGSGVPTRHGHLRVPRAQGPCQVYVEKQGFATVPGSEKQE